MSTQYTTATSASISTAALPPHPLPFFFCSATGARTLGFALTGAFGAGGALVAGAGGGGGGGGGGGKGGRVFLFPPIFGAPPLWPPPAVSSVGSNTSEMSPKRTV